MGSEAETYLVRLADVRTRLAAHAAAAGSHSGLTTADAHTGERWDQGQVWAHLAEFQSFWLEQLERVVTASAKGATEPVPFGRTVADARRAEIIERDRGLPVTELWASVEAQTEATRRFLSGLDARGWQARGLHPSRGLMTMPAMVERFLIGHLEEHADQLDTLRSRAV